MTPEFSRKCDLSKLAALGGEENLKATAEELLALARRARLPAVRSLSGSFTCRVQSPGVFAVKGRFGARVLQTCSRSGLEFEAPVGDTFTTLFMTPGAFDKLTETEVEDLEDYEIFEENKADIGEIFTQYFLLSLDPYPVIEGDISEKIATSGIKVQSEAEAKQDQSPFSKLKKLKKKT